MLASRRGGDCEPKAAVALDVRSWTWFPPVETPRILQSFAVSEIGGLDATEKALHYRLDTNGNLQAAERVDDSSLRFRAVECACDRRTKGKAGAFPLRAVRAVDYSQLAGAVDGQVERGRLDAAADPVTDAFCAWVFRQS